MVPSGDSSMMILFRLLCKTPVVSNAQVKE